MTNKPGGRTLTKEERDEVVHELVWLDSDPMHNPSDRIRQMGNKLSAHMDASDQEIVDLKAENEKLKQEICDEAMVSFQPHEKIIPEEGVRLFVGTEKECKTCHTSWVEEHTPDCPCRLTEKEDKP